MVIWVTFIQAGKWNRHWRKTSILCGFRQWAVLIIIRWTDFEANDWKVKSKPSLHKYLKGFEDRYHKVPKELVADAGYGSEENYNLLKSKKIKPYVKYNYFRKDQKSGQITTSQNNPKLAKIRERLLNFSIPKKASNSENSDVTMLNLFLQSSNTTKTLNALCFEEKPRSK